MGTANDVVTEIILPVLTSIAIVALFITVAFVVTMPHILTEKARKTSKRYAGILAINGRYHFNGSVSAKYEYRKALNSKQQFDKFDFNKYLREIVSESGIAYWERLNKAAQENAALYSKYLNEIALLSRNDEPSADDKKQLFSNMYRECENKLCDSAMLKPVMSFYVVCSISYTSPQGRNSYSNHTSFTYNDILNCAKEIKRQEEFKNSKEYQRRAMSQKLRYEIFRRDGFRCVICGRGAEDGVKLHVDHILPIAKGGKTVKSNLRTLCEDCNRGKGDKYDPHGFN